jgi:hypothetical protein
MLPLLELDKPLKYDILLFVDQSDMFDKVVHIISLYVICKNCLIGA